MKMGKALVAFLFLPTYLSKNTYLSGIIVVKENTLLCVSIHTPKEVLMDTKLIITAALSFFAGAATATGAPPAYRAVRRSWFAAKNRRHQKKIAKEAEEVRQVVEQVRTNPEPSHHATA